MTERWLGIVVGASEVTVVDAEVPDDADTPIVIQSDQSWSLKPGARPAAYDVMHRQLAGYTKENAIDRAVIKGSALSQGATKKSHLDAAELRGVVMARSGRQCCGRRSHIEQATSKGEVRF